MLNSIATRCYKPGPDTIVTSSSLLYSEFRADEYRSQVMWRTATIAGAELPGSFPRYSSHVGKGNAWPFTAWWSHWLVPCCVCDQTKPVRQSVCVEMSSQSQVSAYLKKAVKKVQRNEKFKSPWHWAKWSPLSVLSYWWKGKWHKSSLEVHMSNQKPKVIMFKK